MIWGLLKETSISRGTLVQSDRFVLILQGTINVSRKNPAGMLHLPPGCGVQAGSQPDWTSNV